MIDFPGQVLGISNEVVSALGHFNLYDNPFAFIDILIVSLLFYWIYFFLRETRAMRILYGIAVLGILLVLGRLLDLTLLNFVMRYLVASILVAIPIVFQPELRAALERLGRTRFVSSNLALARRFDPHSTIETVVKTVIGLSRRKVGALIVLAGQTGLRDFIETGVELNADLSRELLWNIFTPKTPLHDGAVIIIGNKIAAASARLPLSEEQYAETMGTRHRAAIGLSAQTDALAIVVSEESGRVSMASGGVLIQDLTEKALRERLQGYYQILVRKVGS